MADLISNSMSQLWLLRTSDNQILGPMSKDDLSEKILSGQLKLEDEICPGNGYWFFLHEQSEVQSKLGIRLPPAMLPGDADEKTLATEAESTFDLESDFAGEAAPTQVLSMRTEATAVFVSEPRKDSPLPTRTIQAGGSTFQQPTPPNASVLKPIRPRILPQVPKVKTDHGALWKALTFIFFLAAIFLGAMVLRLLRGAA